LPIRVVRVAGVATVAVCVVASAAYGLVSTLPAPTHGDRVAVRVLDRLQSTRGRGGVMQIGGLTERVSCERLRGGRHLVDLDDGTRLVLSGTHARRLGERMRGRVLASVTRLPSLTSAEADLSGSHALYATQLASQLAHGRTILVGSTVVRGRPAYRLRLTHARPLLELLVARGSLTPLVAVYRSATVSGRTVLGPSTTPYRWHAC